jgi:hypothetical protein
MLKKRTLKKKREEVVNTTSKKSLVKFSRHYLSEIIQLVAVNNNKNLMYGNYQTKDTCFFFKAQRPKFRKTEASFKYYY